MHISQKAEHRISFNVIFLDLFSPLFFLYLEKSLLLSLSRQQGGLRRKIIFKFVGNKMHLFLQQCFLFFFSVFILIAQAPIELVAGYLCVSESNRNCSYGHISVLSWSVTYRAIYPDSSRLNFKKNAFLVKEYYWGDYQGKAVRIPDSTLSCTH